MQSAPGSRLGRLLPFYLHNFPSQEHSCRTSPAVFDRDTCIALAVADRTLAQRGWTLPRSTGDTLERHHSDGATWRDGAGLHDCLATAPSPASRAPHDLPAPPGDQRVLRELTLSITWDDDAAPVFGRRWATSLARRQA